MWLAELLHGIATVGKNQWVSGICLDSRCVKAGDVFFALSGHEQHGLQFAQQAQAQGALAIVYEPEHSAGLLTELTDMTLIAVAQLALKCGEIAARFYGQPSQKLTVIGFTGTNGKTSCSQFLAQIMPTTAVIGTLGYGPLAHLQCSHNTTPDALTLQRLLADFVRQNITTVAMEVSSHSLVQGRVQGIAFKGAVFTNITQDHLDYHGTMEAYFQAKLRLFTSPDLAYAVLNLDDCYTERILAVLSPRCKVLGFSLNKNHQAALYADALQYRLSGICCDLHWQGQCLSVQLQLFAEFNVQNVLAVLGVLLAEGYSFAHSMTRLAEIKAITGRMECFAGDRLTPLIVVDYAHTPDALAQVLHALRKQCKGELTVVFGCGGNRDQGKRPKMGTIAATLADKVIVTDDNPRLEASQFILDEIIRDVDKNKYQCIANRAKAIHTAITQATGQDIVLIAGKGHENYQDIQGVKRPFSDRTQVMKVLNLC